jgi:solute carrier family 50 protein (sugar transporter)
MALALACSTTAIILYLSPLPLLRQIQKDRSTKSYSVLPLAATTLNGLVWAWYGLLTHQWYPMFVVNGIGSFLAATYVCIFCRHASSIRQTAITLTVLFLTTVFVLSTYVLGGQDIQQELDTTTSQSNSPTTTTAETSVTPSGLANRVGMCGVVVGTCMFAAPFATVRRVLQTKSADSLPFPIIFVNAVNGVLWTMYGLQLNDAYVFGPNFLGFLCAAVQLALHQRYSNYWCIRHFDSKKKALSLKKMQHEIINPFASANQTVPKKKHVGNRQKSDLEVEIVEKGGGGGGGTVRQISRGISASSELFSNSNRTNNVLGVNGGGEDRLHVLRV